MKIIITIIVLLILICNLVALGVAFDSVWKEKNKDGKDIFDCLEDFYKKLWRKIL